MQAIVGENFTVPFHFIVDREYVTPDSGSISYTLYGNSGAAIAGQTNIAVSLATGAQVANLQISSTYNTIAGGKDFEQRKILLKFTYNSKAYVFERTYFVTNLLNHNVTPEQVIFELGLLEGEVLFDEVDLVGAYYEASSRVGSSILTTMLSSGTLDQIKGNEIIRLLAALKLANAIQLRAFRKAGGDTTSYARFDKVDFTGIITGLQTRLDQLVQTASSESPLPTLMVLGSPATDAVTGA